MLDALNFLAAPLAMCIVLSGIHCYLGLHVLARGIIFVDLSLAQIAAFGATVAVALGFDHDSSLVYFCSLSATFLAAALFALARRHEKRFSQEAVIGITYALGSAAVVLLVEHMAHGAEHIKELLIGQILWVSWQDVAKTALIYAGVGLVHYIFRKPLLAASFAHSSSSAALSKTDGKNPKLRAVSAERAQSSALRWDFLFYALFGITITSSVHVAGVLQVFAYLIVPALLSSLFCRSLRGRLLFGWGFGSLFSFLGMGASFALDMPSGAFIVVLFTAMPVLLLLFFSLRGKRA